MAILHVDRDGLIVGLNPRLLAMLGFTREELLGRHFLTLCLPEDVPATRERAELLFSGAVPDLRAERRYLRKDGSMIWGYANYSAITGSDGRVSHVVVMVEDITERRAAEQQVRFQARLLDRVQQAVIAVDRAGVITYWNDEATRLYGWSAEEAMGRTIMDVAPTDLGREESEAVLAHLAAGESATAASCPSRCSTRRCSTTTGT